MLPNQQAQRLRLGHPVRLNRKMKRSILILLAGLVIGAVVSAYFLGAYRTRALPGAPLRPPDQSSDNSGSVSVSIDEKFLDALLATIFQKLGPPQLKLS